MPCKFFLLVSQEKLKFSSHCQFLYRNGSHNIVNYMYSGTLFPLSEKDITVARGSRIVKFHLCALAILFFDCTKL